MSITISRERPDTADAMLLIDELEATLAPLYPDESRHGYSVEKLIKQDVAFFILRKDGVPSACGGVQLYGDYAEVKRMYVRPDYRGQGLAKYILGHLEHYARKNDLMTLRLETGIYQNEAVGLYKKWGFVRIQPFGEYQEDPNSIFFEKMLL